jgi:hypothetical protein
MMSDLPAPPSVGFRRKILRMSDGFLPVMLGDGEHHYRVVGDALPLDAKIMEARVARGVLELVIESGTFDRVRGHLYPEITPRMETIDDRRSTGEK